MSKRIGIFQTSALGDCLLATPVIETIREKHRNDKLVWYIFDQYEAVAENNPDIDEYVIWPTHGMRREIEHEIWPKMLKQAKADCDHVYVPQIYPFHDWRKDPHRNILHQMYDNCGLAVPDNPKIRFDSPGVMMRKGVIACNVASNTVEPAWRRTHFLECVRLLGSEYKIEIGEDMGLSLVAWHQRIKSAEFYIGFDSGGSWLAASTHTPQVVLYRSDAPVPQSMTSVARSGVKPVGLVAEFTDTTPEAVADYIVKSVEGLDRVLEREDEGKTF